MGETGIYCRRRPGSLGRGLDELLIGVVFHECDGGQSHTG